MTQRTLEIVVTCDEGYLGPLRTMLLSLRANNRAENIRVWILHRGIPQLALESLAVFLRAYRDRAGAPHGGPGALRACTFK